MSERLLHIVHTESSCGWGGQEIRVLTEAKGMIGRGHRVTLVAPAESRIAQAAPAMGIPVVTLPIARKRLPALWAMLKWLLREGRGIDVINSHSSTDSWLVALACTLLPDAPPIVRTRHVSSPVNTSAQTRWLYQRAVAHVVTTGEALRQQLQRDNGFRADSMTSVPTGIDLARFTPLPADQVKAAHRAMLGLPAGPVLGILATLRNWKGHAYLLDAFASLASDFPEWSLLVVGDGPQRKNLEAQAARLALSERVRFVGNRDDPEQWFKAMDIFVLPSYGDEGVPQSIMQAMASALPVISTPVGAIPEVVEPDLTGLLVATRDSLAIAAALRCLMCDERLREGLGQTGRTRAQARFGIDNMLDRMETIFRAHARVPSSCAV
ncbi:glycosyltransferase family 4 protein [Quatrionicoccus australiensis]|uniref:glycosyltransferase family 4 protein n=1 Tax=Quatrionicoccus australiensis TaxID=138118 RepID=UPI001CF98823|nr:glycosyltransferase family 4 protein [Quatrionicoccus australiensis]MCB4360177.1 glycosyltransferase family 4 protein [Quatrionicoccus australiensis]